MCGGRFSCSPCRGGGKEGGGRGSVGTASPSSYESDSVRKSWFIHSTHFMWHEMGMWLGVRAISSTSSMEAMSTLLYTYRHLTYRRLPWAVQQRDCGQSPDGGG